MDIAKFFVAIGIGVFMTLFLSNLIGLIYPAPTRSLLSTSDCQYPSLTECQDIITQKCPSSTSSDSDYSSYYQCTSNARASAEYKKCSEDSKREYDECIGSSQNKVQNYQIITIVIYNILGLVFIILGFLLIKYRSIGSGLILGGISTTLFSSTLSFFSSLSSIALLYGASSTAKSQITFKIISLLFNFLILSVLILFSLFKLEKDNSQPN